MATIKTTGTGNNIRIITKTVDGEQRPSCTCCETGCCLYSAGQYLDLFTFDDLPDELRFRKNGVFYTSSKGSNPLYVWNIGGLDYSLTFDGGSKTWKIFEDNEFFTQKKCLITDRPQEGVDAFFDNFATEYQFIYRFTENGSDNYGNVSREELSFTTCVFGGSYSDPPADKEVAIYYDSEDAKWKFGRYVFLGGQWQLILSQWYGEKEGNQNSPVGIYTILKNTDIDGNLAYFEVI